MDSTSSSPVDYNDTLRKVGNKEKICCEHSGNNKVIQISQSLQNALDTFGPDSRQYQIIRQILKDLMQEIHKNEKSPQTPEVDADMLSVAMKFLEIGG